MGTRTRKPAAERREEIARAVLLIIGKRGLTALTMVTLAEAVGITSGALFRHFDSREAMLGEAVRYAIGRIEETFPDASLPAEERLFGLARARLRILGSDPGLAWLLRSEQAYLTLPADAVKQLRDLVARSRAYLLDALREGVAQGSIRGDIEPEVLLIPVMGTIHALVGMPRPQRLATGKGHPGPEDVLSALERMLAPPGEAERDRSGRKKARKRIQSNRS